MSYLFGVWNLPKVVFVCFIGQVLYVLSAWGLYQVLEHLPEVVFVCFIGQVLDKDSLALLHVMSSAQVVRH